MLSPVGFSVLSLAERLLDLPVPAIHRGQRSSSRTTENHPSFWISQSPVLRYGRQMLVWHLSHLPQAVDLHLFFGVLLYFASSDLLCFLPCPSLCCRPMWFALRVGEVAVLQPSGLLGRRWQRSSRHCFVQSVVTARATMSWAAAQEVVMRKGWLQACD